jgi:nucleotide-binding universal stress UspA family protein
MKILLAVDGSRFSEEATHAVIAGTKSKSARVRVLHVTEPVPIFVAGRLGIQLADGGALRQARREYGERLAARAVGALRKAGFKADWAVLEGDAKSKIIDYAAKWGADLIVLGSHGYTGMERFLLGSVSDAVARHARCSVEIVRAFSRSRPRRKQQR